MLGVDDAEVDELHAAMDWLGKRQNRIQGKLARCHFRDGGLVLFDLTSRYFEGTLCPLGRRGHNRDGKMGKLQVNFGSAVRRRRLPGFRLGLRGQYRGCEDPSA